LHQNYARETGKAADKGRGHAAGGMRQGFRWLQAAGVMLHAAAERLQAVEGWQTIGFVPSFLFLE